MCHHWKGNLQTNKGGAVQNGPRGSELEWQMSVWLFAKLNIAMDGYR